MAREQLSSEHYQYGIYQKTLMEIINDVKPLQVNWQV